MIEIIKRGTLNINKRKFSCSFCNTIFIAERDDYETLVSATPGMAFGEVTARCACPVCHRPCYVSYPYDGGSPVMYNCNNKRSLGLPQELELETEGAE